SNDETWPACLERKIHHGVDNGGMPGYGAALSLKRAIITIEKKKYSTVILSVLVGDDFMRDRYSYKFGMPRPAVVKTDNSIEWSPVSDPNKIGTWFNPSDQKKIFIFLYERSLVISYITDRLMPGFNFSGNQLKEIHSDAADVEEIITWTLEKFSKISVQKKILVLQYGAQFKNTKGREERSFILKTAKKFNLKIIDTFDRLDQHDPMLIWTEFGNHHTPLGNEIVCDYLFEHGFKMVVK
ncbi:hypothetical protein VU06_02970, partial [Desulfobulbus sp. F3]|nr:hypothetical protein [Desulfobulbus sp. F3]